MNLNTKTSKEIVSFIRELYQTEEFIPLHSPVFNGNEKDYLIECIDSTFVSSVGKFVDKLEIEFAKYVGSKYSVAVVNGTSALHLCLKLAGVEKDDEVLTQALTFVATCNSIRYQNAHPVFIDVSKETLGLSPIALEEFLKNETELRNGECFNKSSGRRIKACLPMHTFGLPVELKEIKNICDNYNIVLVEDSAESIGSHYFDKHTGNTGLLSAFSFNGNKTITAGGGGMIVTNDESLAKQAKYLSTVAKRPHPYEFYHTELAYNYRMPNLNAALLLAQLEQLDDILLNKRSTAYKYMDFFSSISSIDFVKEPEGTKSNYWLNALKFNDKNARDEFLKTSNNAGVMTRPIWNLMTELPEFKDCQRGSLVNSIYLADRIVNIPSSYIS